MTAHDVFSSATRWTLVLAACVLATSTTVVAEEGIGAAEAQRGLGQKLAARSSLKPVAPSE